MRPDNHIVSAIEVVAPQQTNQVAQKFAQDEQITENKQDSAVNPAFTTANRLHSNGRIFHSIDNNGNSIAVTISPYFDLFHTQVEEDIAPVVMALKERGYFTVSSCAGHPRSTHVTICFPNEDARDTIAKLIEEMEIPTAFVTKTDYFFNVDGDTDRGGRMVLTENEDVDRTMDFYRSREAESINSIFFRSYERYVFLTVTMFNDWNYFLHPLKAYKVKMALPRKNEIISLLADGIMSDTFPQNLD